MENQPITRKLDFSFFDSAALAETVTDAELEISQQRAGAFEATISSVSFDRSELVTGSMNQPIRLKGTYPKDVCLFSFMFSGTAPMKVRGIDIDPADTIIFGQDGAETEELDNGNYRYGNFAFGREDFLEMAETVYELDPEIINASVMLIPGCTDLLEPLRKTIREAEALAEQSPNHFTAMEESSYIENLLMDGFMNILSSKSKAAHGDLSSTGYHHQKILKKADSFIQTHRDQKIGLSDLCKAIGTSKRTLQYVFNKNYGMSPMSFLKIRRLNQARHDLLEGDSFMTSVSEIAFRCGFFHLSRFAVEYGNYFGERPSETLRRRERVQVVR